jgi:hypothetical protein
MNPVDLRSAPPPSEWGVQVDPIAVGALAEKWASTPMPASSWDYPGLPSWEGNAWIDFCIAAVSVVVCLWPPAGADPWEVDFQGERLDDAPALFSRFAAQLNPSPDGLDFEDFRAWSHADGLDFFSGRGHLQLVPERITQLRRVAEAMSLRWNGDGSRLIQAAEGDANEIVELLVRTIPRHRDETTSPEGLLRFNKLAHLAVSMMAARSPISIHGLERFPVYPDYMLPVVLRHHGALQYAEALAAAVDSRRLISHESEWEIGIRWATVYAGELLRRELAEAGNPVTTPALDFHLWSSAVLGPDAGQMGEHHRTVTMAY